MVANGCEWLRMAANGCEWLGMVANGWEWLRMAGNGCEWLGMAGNGCEWLQMAGNVRIVFSPLVLRHYIKQNLTEESFLIDQRKTFIQRFSDLTFKKETIATSLQNIHSWIGILKRLMVPVLSNVNVSLDVPIQLYLDRTDLWTGNITVGDLQTFEVHDDILLQHTYIILKGLENERDKILLTDGKKTDMEEQFVQKNLLQNVDSQLLKVKTWHNNSIGNPSMTTRVIKNDKKKIRVD